MLFSDISRRIRYDRETSLWLFIIFTIIAARHRLWNTGTNNILPTSLLIPTADTDHAGVTSVNPVSKFHDVPRDTDTLHPEPSKDGSRWTVTCSDLTFARFLFPMIQRLNGTDTGSSRWISSVETSCCCTEISVALEGSNMRLPESKSNGTNVAPKHWDVLLFGGPIISKPVDVEIKYSNSITSA